jgi:hypothetical protein
LTTRFSEVHSGAVTVFTPDRAERLAVATGGLESAGTKVTSNPARVRICRYEKVLRDPLSLSGVGILLSTMRMRPRTLPKPVDAKHWGHAARQGAADVIVGVDTDNNVPVAKKSCRGDDADVTKTDNDDSHRLRQDVRLAQQFYRRK